jgi:hypothetical protein
LVRHADFLGDIHAATRRLLSVAQGGIEYSDVLCLSQIYLPGPQKAALTFPELRKLKRPSSDAVDDGLLLILILLNHPPLF